MSYHVLLVLGCIMLHYVELFCTMLQHVVLCYTVLPHVVLSSFLLYACLPVCNAVRYSGAAWPILLQYPGHRIWWLLDETLCSTLPALVRHTFRFGQQCQAASKLYFEESDAQFSLPESWDLLREPAEDLASPGPFSGWTSQTGMRVSFVAMTLTIFVIIKGYQDYHPWDKHFLCFVQGCILITAVQEPSVAGYTSC